MLQTTDRINVHGAKPPLPQETVFYPSQFTGRAALASVVALAHAHGQSALTVTELAASLGIGLPSQVGVQDVMRAAEQLGLTVQLKQLPSKDLANQTLPLLLLCPDSYKGAHVLLLTQCDNRYVVTHDHASAVPLNSMGPLYMLANEWAPTGAGWCLLVKQPLV